jgi:putative ABC transport system permease protein
MMIRNYLKTAIRYILKHKGYTIINLLGLALGLACGFLMILYVLNEISYDRYHKNANRIYRITEEYSKGDRQFHSADIYAFSPLQDEIIEIERSVRIFTYSWKEKALVSNGDKFFYEENFFLADPSIFDVFSWNFIIGDPKNALQNPNAIVITESISQKYFGQDNPIGKILSVKNLGTSDFEITGVIEDIPVNSHFRCDFIAPLVSGKKLFWDDFLTRNSFYTYVQLRKGSSASDLIKKLSESFYGYLGKKAEYYKFHLQPLTSIHLHSHLSGEIEANSDVGYIYLFSILAFLVLSVACINYINLSTARSKNRAKEVGLRKVVGANRRNLIMQFLGESLHLSIIAFPLAVMLVELLLPAFNSILNRDLSITPNNEWGLIFFGLVITVIVGLFSGIYPAIVLSGFQPIKALKGEHEPDSKRSSIRHILVIFQYSISTTLILGTLIILNQIHFIRHRNLGFQKDQVIILPMKDWQTVQSYDLIKTAWLQSSTISSVTASQSLPSDIRVKHNVIAEGASGDEEIKLVWNAVDFDFLKTYGIELSSGRSFSQDSPSDNKYAYILNESAVKILGWEAPLGKKIQLSNKGLMRADFELGEVIGVVKDFHHHSLHEEIEPLIMNIYKGQFRYIAVKINSNHIKDALDFMKTQWENIIPGRPFDYFFFDDNVEKMYQAEQKMSKVFKYSALLSVFIACMGLFGLVSFNTSQRTKEIGIRKVLGASVNSIVLLISKEFFRLVIISNLIAWPIAYFVMAKWLNNFAYRIEIGLWTFLLSAVFTLFVSILTISFQTVKAASANPVDSLRYE